MEVTRATKQDAQRFEIGDVIAFSMADGENIKAMAVRIEPDGAIFCAVDCLKDEYSMNGRATNKGGYEASKLRQTLNGEILARFPGYLKNEMLPFPNGDLLRLPSEREIFGNNAWGVEDLAEQWEPMKNRRNRIAFQGSETGIWEWYWLQNPAKGSAANFANAYSYGNCYALNASGAYGVRPVFKIKYQ